MSVETPRPRFEPARFGLVLAVLLHFVLGGVYLLILPLWGAVPDEPIHYSTIKYDAEFLRQPKITDPRPWGEPLSVYCFTADPSGAAGHGPLYYWSSVPLFELSRGLTVTAQLYLLRFWTLCFSALMIPLAWLILRRLFPDDPGTVTAGTLVVCLLPHRLLMSAVVYNDIACATATFFYLWLLLRAASDEGTARDWLLAGLALGLAFLAKRVALVTIPGSLVMLFLQGQRRHWSLVQTLGCAAAWAAGAALVGGWWLARDVALYGKPFPTEPGFEQRHLTLMEQWYGQPPPGYSEASWHGFVLWKARYTLRSLWLSLWSQVGWVPVQSAVGYLLYGAFGLGSVLTVVGYFGGLKTRWRGLSPEARDALTGFVFMALGMTWGAFQWVMEYSFHNHEETGKHAISIFVCLVALMAATWRWLLGRRAVWGLAVGVVLMALFNLAALHNLTTDLIPRFRPPTPSLANERVRDIPSGAAPGIYHRHRVPGVVQRGGEVPEPQPGHGWQG